MSRLRSSFGFLIFVLVLTMSVLFPVSWSVADTPKADLNLATLQQLESVTGIGHDTAEHILAYKKEHGPFRSMDDLLKVKGVGKVRLKALAETFTIADASIQQGKVSQK